LTVGRALDRVRAGFEPEMRLAKLQLEVNAGFECGDLPCDERFGTVVTGLVFATLSWLNGYESPRIEVRIDSPSAQTIRMQVVQRAAPAPPVQHSPTEAVAFACARAFAASQGGSLDVGPVGQRGALIQLAFSKSPHA
jgi:hypothetical protein